MELALNLAWLALCLTLIVKCRRQATTGDRRALAVIAMICLIAFLFPVVSITDDLNGAALPAEAGRQKRWLLAGQLPALIAAAFLALSMRGHQDYALVTNPCARARKPFVVHSSRRPPPPLG